MKDKAEIIVTWNTRGTWSNTSFRGVLKWQKESLFFDVDEDTPDVPVVEIIDSPGGDWNGMIVKGRQVIPGKYADGYDHPLSGLFFTGEIKVGNTPNSLAHYGPPPIVFPGTIGYLHIDNPSQSPTPGQRELVIEAVKINKSETGEQWSYFPAGLSLLKWASVSRDEFEGKARGEVYYA